jgi:hypothetical protein
MPYRFKDLIVTVVPPFRPGDQESSGSGGGTVGSCTSECGGGFCLGSELQCGDSGEMMEIRPYRLINPEFQLELRQLLVYALARSAVKVPEGRPLSALEEQMQPRSIQEVKAIESQLATALREVRLQKDRLQPPSLLTRLLRLIGLAQ